MRNIFVVGLDPFNQVELESLTKHDAYADCVFHPLLSYADLKQTEGGSFDELLDKARKALRDFDGAVDAIMTFWDFPAMPMVSILCEERGLPHTPIEEVEKCEHKYWSRLLQQQYVPEVTPKFDCIDPMRKDVTIALDYPYWLKPVNSFSSFLAFYVQNDADRDKALTEIRANIEIIAQPYNELLKHVDLPDEVASVDGHYCLAEAPLTGRQCTLEGYATHEEVRIYGIVDSVLEKKSSSFARYQYPSSLPLAVQKSMVSATQKLMESMPYEHGPFNIEFFYNEASGDLKILELNPRLSQSHSELFREVDGESHFAVALDLALGRTPEFPQREGEFAIAAKLFLRHHQDAYVARVPDAADIARATQKHPDLRVHIAAEQGKHLSDDKLHDSYSYELAQLFLGADDEEALLKNYHECLECLHFELEETQEDVRHADDEEYQPRISRHANG